MRIPNPYTERELAAMLAASRGASFRKARDTALVLVLLDTGLRTAECCGLSVADVELDAERIRVRGKGRRERFIGLGLRAQRAVERYLRQRRGERPELWLNRDRQPLGTSGLYQTVRRICREAGVARPGMHRFRHTAATFMRELSIADQDLNALMGWSSPAAIMRPASAARPASRSGVQTAPLLPLHPRPQLAATRPRLDS